LNAACQARSTVCLVHLSISACVAASNTDTGTVPVRSEGELASALIAKAVGSQRERGKEGANEDGEAHGR
jgi:hypothetical protein